MGIDIVDVARLSAALERTPRLRERLFTEGERSLPLSSLAARFAAKEAVAKALGAPRNLGWQDAEIVRLISGQPMIKVSGSVAVLAQARGIGAWHVSLSHDGGMATAVVVAER